MTSKNLTIEYDEPDILVLLTEPHSAEGETVASCLSVHYNRDGEVMMVVVDHAAKMLGPYLFPDDEQIGKINLFSQSRDMTITYTPETDTLSLQTGEPPYTGYTEKTVAPGLRVNFDPEGWAMGVVIERAAQLCAPTSFPRAPASPDRLCDNWLAPTRHSRESGNPNPA